MSKKLAVGIIFVVGVLWLLGKSKTSETHRPHLTVTDSPALSKSSPTDPDPKRDQVLSTRTFAGDPCTSDCSGHEAGYNWAQEHDIDDEDACETAGDNSNSPSFAAGCGAYVNGEDPDESDDGDPDDTDDPDN
jgi:hypothetical protein